ncbi:MAG: VanZ family protein [Bacteroidota bacterium]
MLRWTLLFFFIAVTFLSLKPRSVGLELEVNDKLGHALAYFVLTMNSLLVFDFVYRYRIIVGLFLYGVLIELLQGFIPGRYSSWMDLLANGTGIILGLWILFIFGRWIRRLLNSFGIRVKN